MAAQKAQTKFIRKKCAKATPITCTRTHELRLNFCLQDSYDLTGHYCHPKEQASYFDTALFYGNACIFQIAYSHTPACDV
jgi:hypothetical protein